MLPKFVDIHTHNADVLPTICKGYCCGIPPLDEAWKQHPYVQVGIHPWHIYDVQAQLKECEALSRCFNCMAIGEVGLDKVNGAPWELQKQTFEAQVRLAQALNKPLVIHCVKASDEVLQILKAYRFNSPVIFHGFNGSEQQALQLVKKGYFLSFGKTLAQADGKTIRAFKAMPRGTFFIETDDTGMAIAELYQCAAKHRNTEKEALKIEIWKLFCKVFQPIE